MIRTQALGKTYGGRARAVTALGDVSLELGPGVWGVVGPNGAGKTTLLGLILGFLHPTDGSVRIDGSSPRQYLRRHGAAYLPERFRLPAAWPVRAALRSLARLDGQSSKTAPVRVDEAIARMGLEDHADRSMGSLSRGLNQRVGLAQALLTDRPLMVLDEPTEGLDPLWRIRFREALEELRTPDRVVLLASHDLPEVERLADRVILLDDGRVTELMDARQPATGSLRFRLSVRSDDEALRTAFPSAEPVTPSADPATPGTESATPAGGDPRDVLVRVADARELSHRLAALLDAGATVHGVTPLTDDLETRVRQRLEDG